MAKTEQLLEFERERAKQIPSTPSDIEHVQIIFPENVVGLEMLDIGAGVSTVGRELQMRGAKVTTLDRRYDNLANLRYEAEDYLRDVSKYIPKYMLDDMSPSEKKVIRSEMEKIMVKFFRMGKDKPGMIAGTAGALPFKSDVFDFVFSQNLISPGLLFNIEVAENAVDEAVRVTKPGGQVQIAPIQIMDFSAVQHVRENGIALMGRISEKYPKSSLKFKNPESSYLSHYTLTIIKPS